MSASGHLLAAQLGRRAEGVSGALRAPLIDSEENPHQHD
jgi:hypothetical protein